MGLVSNANDSDSRIVPTPTSLPGGLPPATHQAALLKGRGFVRGKLTPNAPLAPLVWFKSGGVAEWLFEPKDVEDLQAFLRDLDPATPVWPLGLGSNLIVRDGGMAGVTVRLGKAFGKVSVDGAEWPGCRCSPGSRRPGSRDRKSVV